jgi:hypothetical protein
MKGCQLRIARSDFVRLLAHLFPGDGDEHGAVLLAGVSRDSTGRLTLHVREIHIAVEGVDYVQGAIGHRALTPQFIHRIITRARDERLAYLAVHNHFSDRQVGFSWIDIESHERGYPALLQIARGMPVGALVFGRRSVEADVWLPDGNRLSLDRCVVVGNTITRLSPSPRNSTAVPADTYDRQIRMFGASGQHELADCRVGIVGVGGIGSLVAEYLSRLGVGAFLLIDNDRVEQSNLSRIVGATAEHATRRTPKVIVTELLIEQANRNAVVEGIVGDVAVESVAQRLKDCDYIFLAADSMRSRLVFNAVVHQYLIPGVQLGAKVRALPDGRLQDVMSVVRPVRPGKGCLWCNQLIDPHQLALEAKSDEERRAQAYGVEEPNPSVITLNAVAASHAGNDFLFDYLGLREDHGTLYYEHFHFLNRSQRLVEPRVDLDCGECSTSGRYARGDAGELPCFVG